MSDPTESNLDKPVHHHGGLKFFPDLWFGAEADAEAECADAYRQLDRINQQIGELPKQRNCAKRKFLRGVKKLRDACGLNLGFINRLMNAIGRQKSYAYIIADALEFAERAGVLEQPEDWHEREEWADFDEQPIPDFANMAAAESVFRERQQPHYPALQQQLLEMARNGRLPTKRQIECSRQNKHPLSIKLDCRCDFDEPDIADEMMQRIVARSVFQCLTKMSRAGSQFAQRQLEMLRERLKAACLSRVNARPAPVEIRLTGKVNFLAGLTRRQRNEEKFQLSMREAAEEEDARKSRHAAALGFKRKRPWGGPSGFYFKKMIQDGDIKVPSFRDDLNGPDQLDVSQEPPPSAGGDFDF